jgi:MOB kinase activator 1
MRHAAATLGSGNLRLAVKLPEGEDVNEWVAVNTVDFFNQINMLYGTITEFCSESTCPVMSAGPRYEYHWADGQTVKKPIKCSAPKYIDYLMTWVQDQLDDEMLFPAKIGKITNKNLSLIALNQFSLFGLISINNTYSICPSQVSPSQSLLCIRPKPY